MEDSPEVIEYVSLVFIRNDDIDCNTIFHGHIKEDPLTVSSKEPYFLGLEICQELPTISDQGNPIFLHEPTRFHPKTEPRAEAFFNGAVGPCDIIFRTGNPNDWKQIRAVPTELYNSLIILIDREIQIPKGEYEVLIILPCEVSFYHTDENGIDRIVEIQKRDWNFRFWIRGV